MIILERVASPLFPFWHFDAKGGEVALVGIDIRICMGLGTSIHVLPLFYCLCPLMVIWLLFLSNYLLYLVWV
jgi:hypothetical protein